VSTANQQTMFVDAASHIVAGGGERAARSLRER
jgi:hypothetical protein